MPHPLTDIVCLVHNQLDITKKFTENLFKHTENFQLLFVDNGSDEATSKFLYDGYHNKKWNLIRFTKNEGIVSPRNDAAKTLTNDFFLNIDNDQIPGKNWLAKLHSLISKGYDVVGCESWCLYPPNTGGNLVINNNVFDRSYYPFKRCRKKHEKFTYIGCGGMLIKRSVYDKIGLFDEKYNPCYFEDPDFNFRCIKEGFKLGWCYECDINHLANQTTSTQKLFNKNDQFIKSWSYFKSKWTPYFPEPIITWD